MTRFAVAGFVAGEEALVPVGTAIAAAHRLVVRRTVVAVTFAMSLVHDVYQRHAQVCTSLVLAP